MNKKYNIIIPVVLFLLLGLIVHPTVFELVNRIEPWVLGVPFVMFWVVLVAVIICFVMMLWYYFDLKSGAVYVDIEHATQEEMDAWKNHRGEG